MTDEAFALLGIDVGTTHCKAGLFVQSGGKLRLAASNSRATPTRRAPAGWFYIDPQELWQAVAVTASATLQAADRPIAAIGVSSMAETGLLVDHQGHPRSNLVPWFDTAAASQALRMVSPEDHSLRRERFDRAGIYPSFKCSLAKILWLEAQQPGVTAEAVWLSAADYIAFRLTGQMGTDYSLAGRTYAFDLNRKAWDEAWLQSFDLPAGLFPLAQPAGVPVGVTANDASAVGLANGIPVAVTGHDHCAAAFGLGVTEPGLVFDSVGTAESLMGALPEQDLGETEYQSGLSYGRHVAAGRYYWMGGLSASGGSIEWLRGILGAPPISYEELENLAGASPRPPTRIVYFPYLAGRGAPHTDPQARGALVGLNSAHTRADLYQAVLEGTAYEIEFIRRAAVELTGAPIERIIAAGGGTRNPAWMQIKADVSGCTLESPALPEATLLGAALLAALGSGIYASQAEAQAAFEAGQVQRYFSDPVRHAVYQVLYEQAFLPLQQSLRQATRAAGQA